MATIDLNADLETVDGVPTDDAALYPLLSSANGRGGHAATRRPCAAVAHAERLASRSAPTVLPRPPRLRPRAPRPRGAGSAGPSSSCRSRPRGCRRRPALRQAARRAVPRDPDGCRACARRGIRRLRGLGPARQALSILGQDGEITRAASDAGVPFRREAFLDRGYLASGRSFPAAAGRCCTTAPRSPRGPCASRPRASSSRRTAR
jgi:UPF0271 protein